MKQVIQDLGTHELKVADVPPPIAQRGRVIVRAAASLISAGTERMTVEMGNRSLLGKARERPDLVRQVIQKAQREGVLNTVNAVRAKLSSQVALGYSASASGNLFTYLFGPQFKKHSGRFQPFGEALFGAAHSGAFATLYNDVHGIAGKGGSNNSFAMELGLGVDIPVATHIQIRPVEVDYLLTRFGAQNYSASQNNFRYMAGVNFAW